MLNGPDEVSEEKEYSFDEGLEKTMSAIKQLLESQDYVVVGIAGPISDDANVGKTTLSGMISKKLTEEGIPNLTTNALNLLHQHLVDQLKLDQQNRANQKGVIILGAISFGFPNYTPKESEFFKTKQDNQVETLGQSSGLPLSKIDVRVLLCRPDQTPEETKSDIADIIIKNEHAKIKRSS